MLNFLRIKSAALTCITLSLLLSCLYFLSTIHTSPISAAICSLWDRSRSPKNAKHCASIYNMHTSVNLWALLLCMSPLHNMGLCWHICRVEQCHCITACLLGERERAHLAVQLARFFRPCRQIPYRVSTRFYLGVHAVRNIARTVY